jgi:hypothetical protein
MIFYNPLLPESIVGWSSLFCLVTKGNEREHSLSLVEITVAFISCYLHYSHIVFTKA